MKQLGVALLYLIIILTVLQTIVPIMTNLIKDHVNQVQGVYEVWDK